MTAAAHGQYTEHGTPKGATSITPFLAISEARKALDFYQKVFGARVLEVTEMGGAIVHAVLDFGRGLLQIGQPVPEFHLVPQPDEDEVCFSTGVYVPDVDAVIAAAEAAGAIVREPPADFVSGDRFASMRDPFGVRWSVMTRIEDVSEEESGRRVAEWAATHKS